MADRELHQQLLGMGFTLIRESPHLIYRHENGKQFVTGQTPSDYKHRLNALSDAAIVAGLSKRGQEARIGERKRRRRTQAPAAVDPRGAGPYMPPRPTEAPSVAAPLVVEAETWRRNVPVKIENLSGRQPKPKPLPRVPAAHKRAVDNLPRGMRDRVLKLAGGDYTKIKILADNRVEVAT